MKGVRTKSELWLGKKLFTELIIIQITTRR